METNLNFPSVSVNITGFFSVSDQLLGGNSTLSSYYLILCLLLDETILPVSRSKTAGLYVSTVASRGRFRRLLELIFSRPVRRGFDREKN